MRILSGIQPSGALHIGNYFGMAQPAIELQNEGDAYIFIADYHALTSVRDAKQLRENVRDMAITLLACGLDPEKAVLFKHSDVPEVTELTWLLSTITPMGLLERCTSYKDKTAKGISADHGLFAYPVLMAADILLYDSDIVPVGKDQKQHVEVTRDIAIKMNEIYGTKSKPLFKLPEPRIRESTAKVPGLDGEKMSKSYGNTLEIFGGKKALRKKVMKITTDSTPVEDPKEPEGSLIIDFYKLFATESDVQLMKDDFRKGGTGYGDFKQRLFDAYWEFFEPMRQRREELIADPAYVDSVLKDGAEKARVIASEVLKRTRSAMGID